LTGASQRLDKWLWHARFTKTRTLASQLIEAGHVRINRQKVLKSSACVKCGDVLTATVHGKVMVIEVLGLAERRGPAPEAQTLYCLLNDGGSSTDRRPDAAITSPNRPLKTSP
jgi:ribosome-associated heat shock protein Hsp15